MASDAEKKRGVKLTLRLSEKEYSHVTSLSLREPFAPFVRNLLLDLSSIPRDKLNQFIAENKGDAKAITEFNSRAERHRIKEERDYLRLSVNPELLRAISGIGNNLNQIAKTCNTQAKTAQGIELLKVAFALEQIKKTLEAIRKDHSKGRYDS